MGKIYVIKKLFYEEINNDKVWSGIPREEIDNYVWDETGYRPKTYFQMAWTESGFTLRYETVEKELKITRNGIHPCVCNDSAVEFFLMPNPDVNKKYVNLESNPVCAMYVGVGTGRGDNILLKNEDLQQFRGCSRISLCPEGISWIYSFFVPFDFLNCHTGCGRLGKGSCLSANFYKISGNGPLTHYGSWNKIDWPHPDFHRPEFFGELIME